MKRPGVERKDPPHLIAEQAQALLEAIRGGRPENLVRLMLATGLRRGEALGLPWSDVDLDAAMLRVRWVDFSRTSQGLTPDEPTTDKSRRTVTLPHSAVEALRAHRTRRQEEQRTAALSGRSTGCLHHRDRHTARAPQRAASLRAPR